MKKVVTVALMSCLILGSVFAAPKKSKELEPVLMELPSYEGTQFTYRADPRMEVIGMICRLAGYEEFSLNYNGDNAVLSQMDSLFEKYKDHKAVKQIKTYKTQKKISGSAWINLAYHLKSDFSGSIVPLDPYPEHLNPELKKLNKKQLNDLVVLIHDFAADTNFARICILNNSKYVHEAGWFKEKIEVFGITDWAKDFFNNVEFSKIYLNISFMCPGYCFWDYSTGENGEMIPTITVYPGVDYYSVFNDAICIFTQDYANKNFDKVKDSFIKYAKDISIKLNPDMAKEIEKEEVYSNTLAMWMANVAYLSFCKYRAEVQTEEDIEKYWDFQQAYDSVYQYYEKIYGEDVAHTVELLEEYSSNRDKYPDLDSIAEKLNEYINSLKLE